MPRVSRKSIISNNIHVMVQGINKEYIFNKNEDIEKFLYYVFKYRDTYNIEIIAYCMMNNHGHFLIHVNDVDDLGKFMKKCNESYANYYNKKYNRVGVLFRNRYQSEEVYNDSYMIGCIKYIHDNPVKAHIVTSAEQYQFSSCLDYVYNKGVANNSFIKRYFKNNYNYDNLYMEYCERKLIDTKEDLERYDCSEIIENQINRFLKNNNISLCMMMLEIKYLNQLFNQIIKDNHLKKIDIIRYFNISKYHLELIVNHFN